MSILAFHDVNLVKNGQNILESINFSISPGQIISIIGPNGSGKSTIAKLICNIKNPTSGKISKKKDLRIGYVPQTFSIDKFFRIDVAYFLQINNAGKQHSYDHLLKIFNLENKLRTQLTNLSGGEMQRLLLITAFANNPDLLILDEPTQFLDIDGQVELYKIIEDYAKNHNVAILMISHDLYMVMKSSHHVICLHHHICCQGSAQTLQADSKFQNLYGKQLLDFVAPYAHHHNHKHGL